MMPFLRHLMEEISVAMVLMFVVAFLLAYWLLTQRDPRRLPPGPPALPLIGSLPFLAYKVRNIPSNYKAFIELRKEYGDIFKLQMGSQAAIVICGYKYVNEALREKGDYINMRPYMYMLQELLKGNGVIMSNGIRWHDMRKFSSVSMRDFGIGKRSLEERIQDEARIIMELFSKMEAPFSARGTLQKAVCNIICGICFGQRFDFDDPAIGEVLAHIDNLANGAGFVIPENFFPWIEHIPFIAKLPALRNSNDKMVEYVEQRMKEHESTFDEDNIRDFLDLHIQMKRSGAPKETLTNEHMFRTIVDLFIAGTETTATTLTWLLAYMLRYPEVQAKCQQEIDRVVGSGRLVSLSDRTDLTYTQAVINEVQRLSTILALGVPRGVVKDFDLGGYTLPKDAVIILHLHTVHRDDTYWEDADDFMPERWIGDDGTLRKFDAFMPFGLGPRVCLGESLAHMELFLFFANFLQGFNFKVAGGAAQPSLEGIQTGAVQHPEEYELIAERRL